MKSLMTIFKNSLVAALLILSPIAFAQTPPTGVDTIVFGTNINTITSVTLTESFVPGNTSALHYYTSSGAITCLTWTMNQAGPGGGRFIFKQSQNAAKSQLFSGVRGQFQASNTTVIVPDGSFVIGQGYTIDTVGTTNFASFGVTATGSPVSNTPGATFFATATGTSPTPGTGTAKWHEYRSAIIVAGHTYGVTQTVHIPVCASGCGGPSSTGGSTTFIDKWSFGSVSSPPLIEVALSYDPRSQNGSCSIRQY